jgi:hypothetical protein
MSKPRRKSFLQSTTSLPIRWSSFPLIMLVNYYCMTTMIDDDWWCILDNYRKKKYLRASVLEWMNYQCI